MRCGEKINVGDFVRIEMFIGSHTFGIGEKIQVIKDFGGFYKCNNGEKECLVLDIEIELIKPSWFKRLIKKLCGQQ